jgi:hypothetical protein
MPKLALLSASLLMEALLLIYGVDMRIRSALVHGIKTSWSMHSLSAKASLLSLRHSVWHVEKFRMTLKSHRYGQSLHATERST